MSRTALEEIIQQIAKKISSDRNYTIPVNRYGRVEPKEYREYLRSTMFIDVS